MTQFHQHMVTVSFTDEAMPNFKTDAELQAYQQMLGRYVYRAIRGQLATHRDNPAMKSQPVDIGMTTITMVDPEELVATYHGAAPGATEVDKDGFARYRGGLSECYDQAVSEVLARVGRDRTPFTLGAICRDGEWSFHS